MKNKVKKNEQGGNGHVLISPHKYRNKSVIIKF